MLNCCVLTALQLVGIVLFLIGFFPIKKTVDGYADKRDIPVDLLGSDLINIQSLNFDNSSVSRLVLVVIDALRLDFVTGDRFSDNFPYLRGVLSLNEAILFEGKADPPTVTLPRIKAITTGGIPSFVDVIFNFFTNELIDDNFVTQAKMNGKVVNFYGDETWIKLFPNHFTRSEGTTSFFVSDYTEVDLNVSRNLDNELKRFDWDVLILHYLGLDHIGHLQGPYSPLVPNKLREMDDVIKKIHTELKFRTQNGDGESVIVVCGDHGMSDHGSHGGSTKEEILVPILFISSGRRFEKNDGDSKLTSQISMAPTISTLLNLPIPKNNVGLILHRALMKFSSRQKLLSLFANYQQIKFLLDEDGIDQIPVTLHREWLKNNDPTIASKIIDAYEKEINRMSSDLNSKLTNRDMYLVIISIIILWQIFLCFIATEIFNFTASRFNYRRGCQIFSASLILHIISCTVMKLKSVDNNSCLCRYRLLEVVSTFVLLLLVTWLGFHFLHYAFKIYKQNICTISTAQYFLIFSWIVHGASYVSSSFIEEEHFIWNYLNSVFHSVCLIASLRGSIVDAKQSAHAYVIGSWLCSRVLLDWNRGGDKWAHLSDVKTWINREENNVYLSLALICAVVAILRLKLQPVKMKDIPLCIGFMLVTYLKIPNSVLFEKFISEMMVAQLIYLIILIRFISLLIKTKSDLVLRSLIKTWLLLSCLLLRPHNVPLLAILCLQEHFVNKFLTLMNKNCTTTVAVYFMMAMTSFFYQGNGNSLSRIDIAAGYVGLRDYNPILVGILLVIHTYSTLIFWLGSLLLRLFEKRPSDYNAVIKNTSTLILIRSLPLCTIVTVLVLMRNHLFIWSVFSPKFLYEAMHSLVINSLFIATCLICKILLQADKRCYNTYK